MMPRPATLWREVFAAADRALELDPAEREQFVARCVEERPAVGAELSALFAAAAEVSVLETSASEFAAPFLQMAAAGGAPADEDAAVITEPPSFGRYRIRRELGSGGMGTVYLAERSDDQYRMEVALKVLPRWSGGHRRRLQRFVEERQILATLDHPGIARLLDGGVTPDGLPWFAMEYIDGEHIDQYCERRRLSIEARLVLFCDVCAAVEYAHRNLVVHRDLKPSNILVAADGRVALVDFGIARLLREEPAADESASAARTTGDRLLTPLYASPEQIRGDPVSTASDVYALGVLLHALLTGGNPYRLSSFEGYEIACAVLEHEPERPSATVARGGASGKLARRLRGDLDAIVLNAMAKDPGRRYGTVDQLQSDVRRHLTGMPVLARPASRLYHAGRFLRRHRVGAALAAVAATLVLSFATVMAVQRSRIRVQAERITLERDRAQRVSQRFINIFGTIAPGERGVAPRDVLDSAAANVDQQLADQPEEQARLLLGMGEAYHRLGLDDRARRLLERSLALRRSLRPAAAPQIAETLDLLGAVLLAQGSVSRADTVYVEALALRQREPESARRDVARTLLGLAAVRRAQHRFADAERLSREAVEIDRSRGRDGRADLARSTGALAAAVADEGNPRAAAALYREALALLRQTYPAEHLEVVAGVFELAAALRASGEYAAADSLVRYGVDVSRRLVAAAQISGAGALAPTSDVRTRDSVGATLQRAFAGRHAATETAAGVAATSSRIVFVSDRDGPDVVGNLGNQEIYVMNADGSGQRRLTNYDGLDYAPALSRDGKRIAFTSDRGGTPGIWMMNADGSDQRQLVPEGSEAAWSPDGKRIAFRRGGKQMEIHVINADGSGLARLTDDPAGAHAPAWSPDGRRIAYVSRRHGHAEIFVMNADGSAPVQLTAGNAASTQPAWSPDGRRIAFQSRRDGDVEIYVMDADGRHPVRLTSSPGEDGWPSWSPDGRRIAFYRRVLGHGQVFVMNADGRDVKRLTDLSPVAFSNAPNWGPAIR